MRAKFVSGSLIAIILFTEKSLCQSSSESVKPFISVRADTFALTDVKVIDGTGGPAKDHQTILVENGRIIRVGDKNAIQIPAGIKVVDGAGKTIIPGMVMMHDNMYYGVRPLFSVLSKLRHAEAIFRRIGRS
jgi:predicted amidohydrolase YtcJ